MNSHARACGLIVSALVACGGASAAPAPGANTSGLTVAISKIAVNQREMTLQFTMKNISKGRAHVLIAVADRKLYGFLGSGEQLGSFPRVSESMLAPLLSKTALLCLMCVIYRILALSNPAI